MPSLIKLENIDLTAGTQTRVHIKQEIIDEYAECMAQGDKFPPIVVFKKGKKNYILADGFHRYKATEQNEKEKIKCEIIEGDERDALEYALKANATHGLRRTNKDKRKAVIMTLKDDEWQNYSNHEIARLCAVSEFLVRDIKKDLKIQSNQSTYKTKHGTIAKMNTKKIGTIKASFKKSPEQKASNQLKTFLPKTLSNQLEKHSSKQEIEEIDIIKQALKLFFSQNKK